MRWTRGGQSPYIEDRRKVTYRRGAGIGCGGLLLLLLLSVFLGEDFIGLLGPMMDTSGRGAPVGFDDSEAFQTTPEEEELVDFVSFVLDDIQGTWSRIYAEQGDVYRPVRLVLFRDVIQSACGFAQSATGPFYCPGDEKVYIDLSFYNDLRSRFGAPGDFAQAYVLAHEIGHHVQHLLGVDSRVRELQYNNPQLQNDLSVRMELQADCLAGVWGHSTAQRGILESGDVEEGLSAAAAIGDDRIQRMSSSYINPDSFTHGSSQQRVRWFRQGLATGDPEACDTFSR